MMEPCDVTSVPGCGLQQSLDAARLKGWDRARLRELLEDPMRANPDTVMPPYGRHRLLEASEIERVIDFLHALP